MFVIGLSATGDPDAKVVRGELFEGGRNRVWEHPTGRGRTSYKSLEALLDAMPVGQWLTLSAPTGKKALAAFRKAGRFAHQQGVRIRWEEVEPVVVRCVQNNEVTAEDSWTVERELRYSISGLILSRQRPAFGHPEESTRAY